MCWSRPRELPQAACIPPYHRQALPHLPTALPPPHPGSTCRQHAWHPCCTARLHSRSPPHPGSCGFSSWHLWGTLCPGVARGNGCWQDQGPVGASPGFWLGSELLIQGQPLGRGEQELPAPCPGVRGAGQSQALSSLIGRALHTQVQVGTTSGLVQRQQSARGPQLSWGAGKDPASQPRGGGSQPCPQQPHPTEPQ